MRDLFARLVGTVQAIRNNPVSPVHAFIGALALTAGTVLLNRYAAALQDAVVAKGETLDRLDGRIVAGERTLMDLHNKTVDANRALRAASFDPDITAVPAGTYPAPVDLDPLGQGAGEPA